MKIFNTLTRRKEEFVPLEEGKVKMYVCGPTVYNLIHIGNARPMIIFDTVRRYMEYKGYEVNKIRQETCMILIIYAHPYPRHSRANQGLLAAVKDLPNVEIRSLYDLYPDFNIDVNAEQKAVERADMVVFQHPIQWYSLPPLLKLWIDKVLEHGWAYGHGGTALHGKHLLWAVTTGGGESHFEIGAHPGFDVLSQPLQATAIYCGLNWLPPFAMHCTFICDDETLEGQARHYKQRLLEWQEAHHG